jgi:hypothetical protein
MCVSFYLMYTLIISIVPHHEQQMNELKNILHYKMANLGLYHISINFIL